MGAMELVNWTRSRLTFTHVIILSFAMRLALIVYAEFHDAHSVLKYTDIDYRVFSDATHFILHPTEQNHARGTIGSQLSLGDPYARATYRYTPLLALILTPNEWFHPTFGKLLFSLADVLIGILLKKILVFSGTKHKSSSTVKGLTRDELILAAIWLLNPLPANISTRGSAESLLGLMVIAVLHAALQGRWAFCAALLGLSVHWKIYPIIYVGSLIVFIGSDKSVSKGQAGDARRWISYWTRWIVDWQRIRFGLVSATSFSALSAVMYLLWGHPFLEHSYLYHIGRTDHRHNFSIYFYPLYLGLTSQTDGQSSGSRRLGLVAFIPQIVISVGGGFFLAWSLRQSRILAPSKTDIQHHRTKNSTASKAFSYDTSIDHLPFIFLIQTLTFVALNKVCTSQYFMWYLWFLPLVVPRLIPNGDKISNSASGNGISAKKAVLMGVLWVGAQALWLSQGYRLEFLGESVFVELWVCGALWLIVNAWLVGALVKGYRWD